MKNVIKSLFALSLLTMLSACSITMPVAATSNPVGSKVGRAKATTLFGYLAFNADASIQSAAKNGGITEIATVDIKTDNILNIIVSFETIVTGE